MGAHSYKMREHLCSRPHPMIPHILVHSLTDILTLTSFPFIRPVIPEAWCPVAMSDGVVKNVNMQINADFVRTINAKETIYFINSIAAKT